MNNFQKRILLFLTFCIGTRCFLIFLAKNADNELLRLMGIFAFLLAIGFLYLFFTKKRKTGPETFGEKIWWNNLRPIHGILYLLFAFYAIKCNKNAWIFLLLDVIFGITSFLIFHLFIESNN